MLMTLAAGLREVPDAPILSPGAFPGLKDTISLLCSAAGNPPAIASMKASLSTTPTTLRGCWEKLHSVLELAARFAESTPTDDRREILLWARNLHTQAADHIEELRQFAPWLDPAHAASDPRRDVPGIPTLREVLSEGASAALAGERIDAIDGLASACDGFSRMEWRFLYDETRKLFSIGYNLSELRRDLGLYDLLASEARLASYVAVAQGDVSQEHWFSLGRLLVSSRGDSVMVSWSGSMFEYLMPRLIMPEYENTLIDCTCVAAVRQQIDYGKMRCVPWGVSESGYNRTDVHLNYQYRAFGVPGIGLKRGLAEDLVIAPYATALALMVSPGQACQNLQRLADEGRAGCYGFYEAVDYTPSRMPPNQNSVTIRSYMAHHQGMILLSLLHLLGGKPMQRRFSSCPALKAADLLLQERVPHVEASVFSPELDFRDSSKPSLDDESGIRVFTNPSLPSPEVHLLTNGRYHVAISSAGGGFSRWNDLAVTRWREDPTRDCWGFFIYLRDVDSGKCWSAAHQPTLRASKDYEAIFTQGRAEFRQRHLGLSVHMEITVSPEDDVELRRVTITNRSHAERRIELTSYAEVVMASAAADSAHPAFSNLFVQTEFDPGLSTVYCSRRPRSRNEHPPWMLHLIGDSPGGRSEVSCETDRSRFIGRGGSLSQPAAIRQHGALSGTTGSVLDPIIALRRTISLAPGEKTTVVFVLGMAEQREAAQDLARKYQNPRMADRAFDLAWTHSQVALRQLNASEGEAQLYSRLAGALIYANPLFRANASTLRRNRQGQSSLWSYGISGDNPIVLLCLGGIESIELVEQLVKAHSYWRMKGLTVELVIINEDVSAYRQTLHDTIINKIVLGIGAQLLDKPGGIFVRRHEQIADENLILLQSVARIVFDADLGSFAEQVKDRGAMPVVRGQLAAFRAVKRAVAVKALPQRDLIFNNGLGGFTPDGREYVITLQPGRMTPMPWVNVLANRFFGTVVSESGGAYTWVENAHEFRLTPWNNDPVRDTSGEAFYLRDDETGEVWSPTPLPARGSTPYVIRHGFGYTVFEHTQDGITSELWIYVAMDAPVKFAVLKLRNESGRERRLSFTAFHEWVLGELRGKSAMHVQTELDPRTGALLARNPYSTEFPGRIVFVDVDGDEVSTTGDRGEFIGRNGSLSRPEGLRRESLSGTVGSGLDPCGAVMVPISLRDGEERETEIRLGVGRDPADLQALIQRFRRAGAGRTALEGVWEYWKRALGAVVVETPDAAANVMANGWLLYQTLSSRMWGRTGFYQSGGAYGFRDQLQDSMALVHAEPGLVREHLLRAAAHQFQQGDVQHWWHPPAGRGVRTHFSDDFLWLPFAVCHYVANTGDTGVLDELAPFLEGRPVKPEEDAYYDLPIRSVDAAPLYDHCVRAIENGMRLGVHGLPLIGCGDWNDGMNMVGNEGLGESVWLAFFTYSVMKQFAAVAGRRGDIAFAERCLAHASSLQSSIELNGWDGDWYRRAYFDNGDPLGSASNEECQIDSLPQSWSVISGAADPERARRAMEAAEQRLVRRDAALIQLFAPPFDRSATDPGYIKGYVPGVRENGGQYTHGAIWMVIAFAMMGDHDRAWELFALLNPVNHGTTPDMVDRYMVEPYVIAADVYALTPHGGRGGWTWYTGSAAWMYRLLVETLLGMTREGTNLVITPRLPQAWQSVTIHYRYHRSNYHIVILRGAPVEQPRRSLTLDGQLLQGERIPLCDDARDHAVELRL